MNKIIAIVIGLFFCNIASTQPVEFHTYGGIGADHAYDLIQTENGYFLAGSTSSPDNGNSDSYVLKLNDDLTVDWSRTYGGAGVDQARAIGRLPNGDLLLLALTTTGNFGAYDLALHRIDALSGDEIWRQTYGTADWDIAVDMVVRDSDIYLLSQSYGLPGSNGHLLLLNVDENGNVLNELTISGEGTWDPVDLMANGDSLFLSYSYFPPTGASGLVVIKYDQNLTPLWTFEKMGTDQTGYLAGEMDLNEYGLAMAATVWDEPSQHHSQRFMNIDPLTGTELVETTELLSGEQMGKAVAWYNDVALVVSETDNTYGAGGTGALVEVRYFEGNWFNGTVFGGQDDEFPEGILKDNQGRVLIWGSTFSYGNGTEEMMLIRLPDNTVNNELDVEVTTFEDAFLTSVSHQNRPDFNIAQRFGELQISGIDAPTKVQIRDLQGRLLWQGVSTEKISVADWEMQLVSVSLLFKTGYAGQLVLIQNE